MCHIISSFVTVWLCGIPCFFGIGYFYDKYREEEHKTSVVSGLLLGVLWPVFVFEMIKDAYKDGRL